MPEVWAPFAEKRPVALRESQRRITPVGLVCHTAVSNGTVVFPTGTTRWHFYIGKTGTLYQFFPVNVSAACQLHGNYWLSSGKPFGFLSCESWDGAGSSVWPDYKTNHSGGPAWTAEQMDAWGRLGGWLHNEWGIYLGKATAPRGKGIGQHSDYTGKDPEIRWNTSHACVGTKRKAQMNEVRARMVAAATPPKPTPAPEVDMPTPEEFWEHPLATVGGRRIPAREYLTGGGLKLDAAKERDEVEAERDQDEAERDAVEAALSNTIHGKLNALTEAVSQLRGIVENIDTRTRAL